MEYTQLDADDREIDTGVGTDKSFGPGAGDTMRAIFQED